MSVIFFSKSYTTVQNFSTFWVNEMSAVIGGKENISIIFYQAKK